jgi:O-antigen/teichoic acid export membrane protein
MAENTGRRMVVSGAARAFGLVVQMVVGFFMLPFLVSRLGDYWYGVYFATVGLVANFYLMDFGFANATMRKTAIGLARSDDDEVNRTINTAFRIYVGLGVLVFVSTIVLAVLAPIVIGADDNIQTVRFILLIIGFDLAVSFPSKALAGIVMAKLRHDLLLIIDLFTFGLAAGANVWALLHGFGVIALAVISTSVGLLHSILYVLLAKRLFPPLTFDWNRFDPTSGREMASYSVWAFLIQIANQLRFRIDSLTTGALFGGEAITRYSIGARLVEYAHTPLVRVSNTAMPVLTRMHTSDEREKTSNAVLFLLRFNLLLSVYATGIVIFLGGPFIHRWMGPEYGASHEVASVLVIGFMADLFLVPLTNWLLAAAEHRMMAIANLTEAVVNVILSIVLGRTLGLVGVALGTVIPLVAVQGLWVAPYACRSVGISPGQFCRLALPGALSAMVFLSTAFPLAGVVSNNGYLGIVIVASTITLVYWPTVLFLCLGRRDRALIWGALPLPGRA